MKKGSKKKVKGELCQIKGTCDELKLSLTVIQNKSLHKRCLNKTKKIRNKIGEEQVPERVDIRSHALAISFCTTKTLVAAT
jgi:hypothetical protein